MEIRTIHVIYERADLPNLVLLFLLELHGVSLVYDPNNTARWSRVDNYKGIRMDSLNKYIEHLKARQENVRQEWVGMCEAPETAYSVFDDVIRDLEDLPEDLPPEMSEFEAGLTNVLNSIRDLLLYKNKMYGNSALEPVRVFSKASPIEQINVRIDDKLSRIKSSGNSGSDEDTEWDLLGYLILKRVALRKLATPKGVMDAIKKRVGVADFIKNNLGVPFDPKDDSFKRLSEAAEYAGFKIVADKGIEKGKVVFVSSDPNPLGAGTITPEEGRRFTLGEYGREIIDPIPQHVIDEFNALNADPNAQPDSPTGEIKDATQTVPEKESEKIGEEGSTLRPRVVIGKASKRKDTTLPDSVEKDQGSESLGDNTEECPEGNCCSGSGDTLSCDDSELSPSEKSSKPGQF